jgi:hypothetical protein
MQKILAGLDRDEIDKKGFGGNTALMDAAYKDYIEIIRELISAGADETLQNDEGCACAAISGACRPVRRRVGRHAVCSHVSAGTRHSTLRRARAMPRPSGS